MFNNSLSWVGKEVSPSTALEKSASICGFSLPQLDARVQSARDDAVLKRIASPTTLPHRGQGMRLQMLVTCTTTKTFVILDRHQ